MRKIIIITVFLLTLLYAYGTVNASENQISVLIDGEPLKSDSGVHILEGTTYVPLMPLCKALGAEVRQNKNASANSFIITKDSIKREVKIEEKSKSVVVNGIISQIDVWPVLVAVNEELKQEEIMVPLVFIVQQLGGDALWNDETKVISVDSYVPVNFEDKNLESAVREQIKIPQGEILKGDVCMVEMLIVPNKSISSIEGLQHFDNLLYLDISNNFVTDLSPLRKLNKITSLFIKGNNISDLSQTAAIYNSLKQRDYELKPGFTDKNLESAVRLAIGKNTGDLSISDLSKVTELNADGKGISDLQGIQYLVNMEELELSNNNIKIIDPLKSLIGLKKLSLAYNSLNSAEALSYLSNLEYLDLDNNSISDFTPLTECTNIRHLSVHNNSISGSISLSSLSNIEILDLSENEATEISGFEYLTALKELYLNQNRLSNLSGIGKCQALEVLDVSSNNLQETAEINKLLKLNALYLGKNNISDVSPLTSLTDLKVLDLSNNDITELNNSLNKLTSLTSLYLKGNPVNDFSPISELTGKLSVNDFEPQIPTGSQIVQLFYIGKSYYFVNGEKKQMDSYPFIKDGRTLLPIRYVSETIGASVKWDDNLKMITIVLGDKTVMLWIDKNYALVNGSSVQIDVAPLINDGRTVLPVRFVAESLGLSINWDAQ
ncbi:MAG: hypothetical protein GX660_16675, partial [Clostridiaceae bacterium]|nr:hypothetical protein [Clostridiaceae bacterium]